MALHFIFGNSGSGKSTYIFEKTVRMAAEQPRRNFYVIVPEQFTMQTQRELVERSGRGVIMNIDVVSFERLAYRIFDELGIHNTVMEETGKSLILRRIAEEKSRDLTILKGNIRKMGYIGELKSMISELMQYDISAEDLEEFLSASKPCTALFYKLSDILTMYRSFEDYLREGYVTAERVLEVLNDAAEDSALLRGAVLVFDGFTGFTPVQMKLLRRLMHVAGELYVTVTIDVREQPLTDKGIEDLFYLSRKMTRALTRSAREENIPVGEPVYLDPAKQSRLAENPVLFHLEQNLFRVPAKTCETPCGDVLKLVSLAAPKAELSFAASEICRLMQDRGYRYRDFAIVCGDVLQYGNYADSVFGAYGIPFFVDRKKDVLYHPAVELIRAVLEMVEKNYSCESVFRFLRTGLGGFSREETDALENYAIARGISGVGKWREPFRKPARGRGRQKPDEKQLQEELRELNDLRARLWEQTQPLYEAFSRRESTVREQTVALYEFLCAISLEQRLAEEQERFEAAGEEILASEYRQIYKIIIDLLDKMVDLLGGEILTAQEYADILEAGFSTAKVGSIPPGNDCVILGDIERTRLVDVKVLFFVGVNDGLIPKSAQRGGILSQYDREILEKQQIELAPTAREQAFIQRFYLYLNLTKPSKALYLTYSRMDADQKGARPSYLIGALQRLFEQLQVREIDAAQPMDPVTPRSGMESYLNGLLLAKKGEVLPEWKALHRWYEDHAEWAPAVRELFCSAFGGYEEESLNTDLARLLYGTVLTGSVTRLELFAKCAFAHFLEYGLKLSEREEYAFAPVDMGSMFHGILQRYCARLEEQSDWFTVTEDEQEEMLRESMRDAVLAMPNESLTESARGAHILARVYRIMRRSVWALTRQIRSGSFRPAGYEIDFPTQTENEDGVAPGQVRLAGRIDRMDIFETDEKIYVRVIDYKSGNTAFRLLDLYHGQQLQLAVYLNAALEKLGREHPEKQAVPAGIFYYRLNDPMVEAEEQEEAEIPEKIFEELRLNGLVSTDPDVYLRMDAAVAPGEKSRVIPLKLNKNGSVSQSATTGAGEADFAHLTSFVNARIRRAADRIREGDIRVRPARLDGRTGCDYCPYRSVCGFDLKIPGYGYDEREKLKEKEIWERIVREEKEEEIREKIGGEESEVEIRERIGGEETKEEIRERIVREETVEEVQR